MRVLLDEQIDWRLRSSFDAEHTVETVRECGWTGERNGELLRLAALEFDVFVTMDCGIEYQQNLPALDIVVILIVAKSNRRTDVEAAMPALNRLLQEVKSGLVYRVEA